MTKVIYRKDKNNGEIIGFLPEVETRWGNIMGYTHNEQHNEIDLLWYKWETVKPTEDEYKTLHKELNARYDNELEIRTKLFHKDLSWA